MINLLDNVILTVISPLFILGFYYSKMKYLDKKISIYLLFPSTDEIVRHKVILYSRINYNNNNIVLKNRNILDTFRVKEHSQRNKKIKLYINWRISDNIKLKLKLWLNHIRYKPDSPFFMMLKNKYKNN